MMLKISKQVSVKTNLQKKKVFLNLLHKSSNSLQTKLSQAHRNQSQLNCPSKLSTPLHCMAVDDFELLVINK